MKIKAGKTSISLYNLREGNDHAVLTLVELPTRKQMDELLVSDWTVENDDGKDFGARSGYTQVVEIRLIFKRGVPAAQEIQKLKDEIKVLKKAEVKG